MLRIIVYSLLASGLISTTAWSMRDSLPEGMPFAPKRASLANDQDFQELIAWAAFVEDRQVPQLSDWIDTSEMVLVSSAPAELPINDLQAGMDCETVRALLGDPVEADDDGTAWVYDAATIFFADGGVQGWVETDRGAAQMLTLRNVMMPLGGTMNIAQREDQATTGSGPRIFVGTPSATSGGSGRGSHGSRRPLDRLMQERFVQRSFSSGAFHKPSFLRTMFTNRFSRNSYQARQRRTQNRYGN